MKCKNVLAIPSDLDACGQWRIIQPLQRFRASSSVRFDLRLANTAFSLQGYDGLLLQRPHEPMRAQLVQRCKELGKKVILDLDDRFPILDPDHERYQTEGPNSQTWAIMRQCIEQADGLIVSTPELEAYYRPMNPRILVALNALDTRTSIYQTPSKRLPSLAGKTVMFWSGQLWGHAKNLAIVKDAVEQAIAQVPDLCLMMCAPRQLAGVFSLPADRFLHIEPQPFERFVTVASLADFSLAPLHLDEFNHCKSEIRILESAVWRVPCIASPAAPYQRFYERSQGACLLAQENRPQAWLEHILNLATNASRRRELGDRARLAIEKKYDLHVENHNRESFVVEILSRN